MPVLSAVWERLGRLGYQLAKWPISLIVRGSRRTRVLVVCGEEYLVVQHWLGDGSWMLPGGGCHRNEPPSEGAQREVAEEIGLALTADQFQHQGQFTCQDGKFNFKYDLYIIRLESKPTLQLQNIEILRAQWFNRLESEPSKATPELTLALARWPASR